MFPVRVERLKVRDWRLALVWVHDEEPVMSLQEMYAYCEAIGIKMASREQLFIAIRELRDEFGDCSVGVIDEVIITSDGEKRYAGCYAGKDEYCGFRLPGTYRQRSLRFLCVR